MQKLMPPMDWWDFSTPKTYIIYLGCSRKIPTFMQKQIQPIMETSAYAKTGMFRIWNKTEKHEGNLDAPRLFPAVRLTGRAVVHVAGCVYDRWGQSISVTMKNKINRNLWRAWDSNPGLLVTSVGVLPVGIGRGCWFGRGSCSGEAT